MARRDLADGAFEYDVTRPVDLLQFRVEFRGFTEQRGIPTEPVWAMADTDDSRMIVHFSFQHAHEQAVFESLGTRPTYSADETNPAGPPTASVGTSDGAHPTPVGFAPARASRIVFRIARNDGVQASTTGILRAMQRNPVRVADRAAPAAPELDIVESGIPVLIDPLVHAVIYSDRIVLRPTTADERRDATNRGVGAPAIAAEMRAMLQREAARKPIALETPNLSFQRQLRRVGLGAILDDLPIEVFPIDPTVFNSYSSPPADDETAIEAPYRLIISPNAWARWAHAIDPQDAADDEQRVELWHTRLAYGASSDQVVENAGHRRIVRALWTRDRDGLPVSQWRTRDADLPNGAMSTPPSADEEPFKGSLTRADRHRIVRQTAETWRVGGTRIEPRPVRADRLYLSALGAWLDLHGTWDTRGYSGILPGQGRTAPQQSLRSILRWDHVAPQGRDQFVRVMYPGYLYPFGHRATLVKITERKIRGTSGPAENPRAALFQRMFIVLGDLTKGYDQRDLPFTAVTLSPVVSPDIDDPQAGPAIENIDTWFWPRRGGVPFMYTVDARDRHHAPVKTRAALIWVNEAFSEDLAGLDEQYDEAAARTLDFSGQDVNFAEPTAGGDAKVVTEVIRLRGTAQAGTSTPRMSSAEVVLPAAQRLTGVGAVPIVYENSFRAGTGVPEVGVWAAILTGESFGDYAQWVRPGSGKAFDRIADVPVLEFGPTTNAPGGPKNPAKSDVGSERGGGFIQPNQPIRALSTQRGPVGDLAQATQTDFDPVAALKDALPRLFGLVSIAELIPDKAFENIPSVVTKAVNALEQLVADVEEARDLVQSLADEVGGAAQTASADLAQLLVDVDALRQSPEPSAIPPLLTSARVAAGHVRDALPAATPMVRNRLAALLEAIDSALSATAFLDIVTALRDAIPVPGKDLTFRYDWGPRVASWPTAKPILVFHDPDPRFTIGIEGRVPAGGGTPQFSVLGELRNFELDLLPQAPLLRVPFDHISFRSGSAGKTEVDVVLGELVFQGALSFINDLKDLIPFDGFSDPPFMEVSIEGIKAGFSLALPNLAIGVFSLSNISLGADVHVPFLGDIVTVGFNFCTREKPFVLSVCFLGGGGFFALRLSPERVELLELSLEAGAYLSVDFGVASGSISAAIGVYMKMTGDEALISGFFRLRGEVDVLGLISAAIELAMSLDYYPNTGKVIGRASITVEVEVLCFSGSVTIEAERQFAGSNGDPTFRDAYLEPDGTHPEWDRYLDAFAPEEVPA